MTEILPATAPYPRAVLGWDGTAFRVFAVDGDGHVQVDVGSSALPSGAATAANQSTMITALQLIDNLVGALGSVNTDDLQVDVKTSALPSGAATAANQSTMITALQLIDNLVGALGSVNTDDLQVDVKTSALPSGAATAANQSTMIAALQLIDDLRGALYSVSTDTLRVRSENQLFSFKDKVYDYVSDTNADAGANDLWGSVVPAGEVWVVTNILAYDIITAITAIRIWLYDAGAWVCLHRKAAPTIIEGAQWSGEAYLVAGDRILAGFEGCVAGDDLYLQIAGYKMFRSTNGGPPPPGAQDLTTYTQWCPSYTLTISEDKVSGTDIDAADDCYLYRDFGADYFDALNIDFEMAISVASENDGSAGIALANLLDDYTGFGTTDFAVRMVRISGPAYRVYFYRGYQLEGGGYAAASGTVYYFTLTRPAGGDTVTLYIYSDAGRTILLDTITASNFGAVKWRYLYAFVNRNLGGTARDFDGYVQNVSVG